MLFEVIYYTVMNNKYTGHFALYFTQPLLRFFYYRYFLSFLEREHAHSRERGREREREREREKES